MAMEDTSLAVEGVTSTQQLTQSQSISSKKPVASGKSKKSKKPKAKARSASPPKSKPSTAGKSIRAASHRKTAGKSRAPIGLEGAVDILSPVAMYNLSYIAHEAQGALVFRGYPWSGAPKKKSGARKGKKKR